MTRTLDRRVIRTRRLLRDALLELIAETGYDRLTIADITDRADVRRATFYLHYKDKEELLIASLTEIFDGLVQQLEPHLKHDFLGGKTDPKNIEVVFRHVAENAALYQAIFRGYGTVTIVQRIRQYLAGLVLRQLANVPRNTLPLPREILANYMAGAELAMITWWLENDMPHSPQHMATMLHRLMLDGVRDLVAALPAPKH